MSSFDSDYMLKLAHKKSAESRRTLAGAISDLFTDSDDVLTTAEQSIMYGIMFRVVKDAEMDVRKIIANRLAAEPNPPQDLVEFLANDEIDVAYPILVESPILKDETLIEIIRNRTLEHQLAIAIRHNVSADVSDALVKAGTKTVVQTLLENRTADISAATLEFLVEQSERVDSYQEPLLHRKELTPEMAENMYWWVSGALRKYIIENFDVDQSEVDDLVAPSGNEAIKKVRKSVPKTESQKLARKLNREGRLSPEFLISTLADGEVKLFIDTLSEVTGLRNELVTRFVLEPGGEGLAVACKYQNFSDFEYQRTFTYCHQLTLKNDNHSKELIQNAVEYYRDIPHESATEVVKFWTHNKRYLWALMKLDLL